MGEAENTTVDTRVIPRLIEDEMKQSYVDYAMSVIIGRALPDVRDGLKPVHRRILFAMNEMGVHYNKPFRKSARIVGETLGKYHPHGDSAVYDALVRMAQSFSLRYPLVDGQGNFGSVDGDNAAAMRYTEARLARISDELLADIDKETVNFTDNFDGSLKEPEVLPGKFPNLLVNGSSGIAVGMATSIPPHNLSEVCDVVVAVIDEPQIQLKDVIELLHGPDFPTGGSIIGRHGIREAYATGHGKLRVRGKTELEEKKGRTAIIITEIPYMVNKTMLIEEIAELIKNKVITGISDIRDESDRSGMRIVIEIKKDSQHDVVLNQLHKHTRLQTTQSMILLALVDNRPKVMNLLEMVSSFIGHRKIVVVRRTEYDLRKAEERAHILEGLIKALKDIDAAIALIKQSKSVESARDGLMKRFDLSQVQSQAILDMKLQRLTTLEQEKIHADHRGLLQQIADYKDILSKDERVSAIIKTELSEIKSKYHDPRKTEIVEADEGDIDIEDLIAEEDVVVTISRSGYIKRTALALYRQQRRGGKGIVAATTKEEDIVEHIFIANTHDQILFFTDDATVHWLKVYRIPESSRYAAGKPVVNLLEGASGKITAYLKIKEFDDKHFVFMGTKHGIVKKTGLSSYARPRQGGIRAVTLDEGDHLINVLLTDGEQQILMATKRGLAVKFKELDVRPMGRTARGVKGITLREGDEVVEVTIADDSKTLLSITEHGYGKRTKISDYRLINRGGLGVINIICSDRNGPVVAAKAVDDEGEVMFITTSGNVIRTPTKGISTIGRNTQGMRLMKLNPDDKVVDAARVVVD
jgi:DNA gyrase subunit A